MTDTPEHDAPEMSDENINFLEWLDSGTVGRGVAEFHTDVEAVAEMERLAAELEELEANRSKVGGDESVAERGRYAELAAQAEDAIARHTASKTFWHVQALPPEATQQVLDATPDPVAPERPTPPRPLGAGATPKQKSEHARRLADYEEASERWRQEKLLPWRAECDRLEVERRAAIIALATVKVATVRGTISAVTSEDVLKLRARPHGVERFDLIWKAVQDAHASEREVDRPTLPVS